MEIPRIDRPADTAEAAPPLAALVALLRPVVKRPIHLWRAELVAAGAACGGGLVRADDLLAAIADHDIRFKRPEDARRALELATAGWQAMRTRLATGDGLLTGREPEGDDFAAVLGEGLYGFADGLDIAEVDPDTFNPDASSAFRALGRLAAELVEKEHPAARRGADPVERERVRLAVEREIAVLAAALVRR